MKTRIILAAGVAAALAAAGPAGALVASPSVSLLTAPTASGGNGSDNGIHDTRDSVTFPCNDDGSHYLTYDGPISIWPPNHKYRDVTISATGHPDDSIELTVMTRNDEVVDGEELNGAGNTDDDIVDSTPAGAEMGTGSVSWAGKVRGERSGRGDGRTYSFDVTATFNDEPTTTCTHTFEATVPHDQSGHENKKPSSAKKRAAKRRARH